MFYSKLASFYIVDVTSNENKIVIFSNKYGSVFIYDGENDNQKNHVKQQNIPSIFPEQTNHSP